MSKRLLVFLLASVLQYGCITPIKVTDDFEAHWRDVLKDQPLVAQQYTYQQQQLAGIAFGIDHRIRPYSIPNDPEFRPQWEQVKAEHPLIAGEYMIQQRYLLDLLRSATTPLDRDIGFGRCQIQLAVQHDLCSGGRDGLFIRDSYCLEKPFAITDIKQCFDEQLRCSNIGDPGGIGIPSEACSRRFQKCLTKRPVQFTTVDDPVSAACVTSVAQQNLCEPDPGGSTIFAASRFACREAQYSPPNCDPVFLQCILAGKSDCHDRLEQCLSPNDIIVNGADHIFGELPIVFFKLLDPVTEQFHPVTGQSRPLYGIYDSGTDKVRINRYLPNALTGNNFGASDRDHMQYPSDTGTPESTDILLNGLARRSSPGGTVPFDRMGGVNPAEAEVDDLDVATYGSLDPQPTTPQPPTLIGAVVINELVAKIDYTRTIIDQTGEQDPSTVAGIHVELFMPGDSDVPSHDLTLQLDTFGGRSYGSGATRGDPGKRYWITNITLTDQARTVSDRGISGYTFHLDTGTNLTIINDSIAAGLGLVESEALYPCHGSGTNRGFIIDSAVIEGIEGNYVLNDAHVCWNENAIDSPDHIDVVVGGNFFGNLAVVLDGPNTKLGLIRPPGGAGADQVVDAESGESLTE